MIKMCVGQTDGIKTLRWKGKGLPVAIPKIPLLVDAAINDEPGAFCLHIVTGTGDVPRRPQKSQSCLHEVDSPPILCNRYPGIVHYAVNAQYRVGRGVRLLFRLPYTQPVGLVRRHTGASPIPILPQCIKKLHYAIGYASPDQAGTHLNSIREGAGTPPPGFR